LLWLQTLCTIHTSLDGLLDYLPPTHDDLKLALSSALCLPIHATNFAQLYYCC
jgi:hypothetical protein